MELKVDFQVTGTQHRTAILSWWQAPLTSSGESNLSGIDSFTFLKFRNMKHDRNTR